MNNIKADFTISDLVKWRRKGFCIKKDFVGCYSVMLNGRKIEYIAIDYIAYKPNSIEWYELIGTIHSAKNGMSS